MNNSFDFSGGVVREDVLARREKEAKEGVKARPLTKEEWDIWSGVILCARRRYPFFAHAYSLLSPFLDVETATAYTDRYARVGLGYNWFYVVPLDTKVTWLTHEALHVFYQHFERGEAAFIGGQLLNVAGDLEINSGLSTMPGVDLSGLLLPEQFGLPELRSMEEYASLLPDGTQDQQAGSSQPQDDQEGSEGAKQGGRAGSGQPSTGGAKTEDGSGEQEDSGSGQGGTPQGGQGSQASAGADPQGDSGQGSPGSSSSSVPGQEELRRDMARGGVPESMKGCDKVTPEKVAAADAAGITRRSDAEKKHAHENVVAQVKEHMGKGVGSQAGNEFLSLVLERLAPPKVDWGKVLRSVVSQVYNQVMAGRGHLSYRRLNRRTSGDVLFPGQVKSTPKVLVGVDTSGSMSQDDFAKMLSEVDGILRQAAHSQGVEFFSVDTKVSDLATVRSFRDIRLTGGGGTRMSAAFTTVNGLPRRKQPDIFVLVTDGFLAGSDWKEMADLASRAPYASMVLVTDATSYSDCPVRNRRGLTVLDLS